MFDLFLVIHWRKCKRVHFWFIWKLHEWRRLIKTSAFGFLYLDTRLIFKLSFIPSVSKLVFNIFRIRSANFKGVRWVSSRLLNFIWNYPFGHLPESGKGALNTVFLIVLLVLENIMAVFSVQTSRSWCITVLHVAVITHKVAKSTLV